MGNRVTTTTTGWSLLSLTFLNYQTKRSAARGQLVFKQLLAEEEEEEEEEGEEGCPTLSTKVCAGKMRREERKRRE